MAHHQPESIFKEQLEKYGQQLNTLLGRRRKLGWIRFVIFLLTIAITAQLFVAMGVWGLIAIIPGLALLLFFVSKDADNNNSISHTRTLIAINKEELDILNYRYRDRFDGSPFCPPTHDYANDLDLFGKDSLYQYINRCYTGQGRARLATLLLSPLPPDKILESQQALKELQPLFDWRQHLQAHAMKETLTPATEKKVTNWVNDKEEHFTHPFWKIFVNVFTFISLLSIVAVAAGWISVAAFTSLYLVYLSVASLLSKRAERAYTLISGISEEMGVTEQLITWIETRTFDAPALRNLQENISAVDGNATTQIKRFKAILNRFDFRLNWFGVLFFNTFLLWDTRQMMSLNDWRQKNRARVPAWFNTIASFETFHSLATLHFNHPAWTFPELTEQHFTYIASQVGHPLIPTAHRINNDFNLNGTAKIGLITGSNMAGKSTFLRSIGVSIVLAQAGASVCAEKMVLSPVRLMSSMRIADNLAENTSTFYAELKKLKTIIEAVNNHEKVFILLDEILRGTNSLDRHAGSEALIAQFIKEKAVAVIATHDIELAALQQQYPLAIENYHFDVQVEGQELYFDYKLKDGVCTSMNASILMKKIGIEMPPGKEK